MVEPRVVYSCNHYVVTTHDEQEDILFNGPYELLEDDPLYLRRDCIRITPTEGVIAISDIDIIEAVGMSISDDSVTFAGESERYIRGIHYDAVAGMAHEIIDNNAATVPVVYLYWIKEAFVNAEVPTEIYVSLSYKRTVSELYEKNSCPRCGGEGWYAGLFDSGLTNPSSVNNGNKLVQDFIKYIYTKKLTDGYGSRILNVPGKYDLGDESLINNIVQSELMSFKEWYADRSSSMILNGYSLTDAERLRSQVVSNISIDDETKRITVTVTLIAVDGSSGDIDLMITNQ